MPTLGSLLTDSLPVFRRKVGRKYQTLAQIPCRPLGLGTELVDNAVGVLGL